MRAHFPLVLLASLLLMGCDPILRLYGDRGNVEAHQTQLVQALDGFEAALARNRADLQRLTTAAVANPALAPAAEGMAAVVALHEALLLQQRSHVAELVEEDDYRELNRGLGAIVTEQQMVADRYADIAMRLRAGNAPASYISSLEEAARYAFVPPQYYRTNNQARVVTLDFSNAPAGAPSATVSPADSVADEATSTVQEDGAEQE